MIVEIQKKEDYIQFLNTQINSKNADEALRLRDSNTLDLKELRLRLINQSKQKFKFIIGHSKEEIQPGVYADERKFVKNIQNRIITPSQRITNIQEGVKSLHEQASKFEEYLQNMKKLNVRKQKDQQQNYSPIRHTPTKPQTQRTSPVKSENKFLAKLGSLPLQMETNRVMQNSY